MLTHRRMIQMKEKNKWIEEKEADYTQFRVVLDSMDMENREVFVHYFEKLEPIDEVYYRYRDEMEANYSYYVERWEANKKFQNEIELYFTENIYRLDFANTLAMWRNLSDKEKKDRDRQMQITKKFDQHIRNQIVRRLQKYAKDGINIKEEEVEHLLSLLEAHEKREKLQNDAEEGIPAELLNYFDQYGNQRREMDIRCQTLDFCQNALERKMNLPSEIKLFIKEFIENVVVYEDAKSLEEIISMSGGTER